MSAPKKVIAAVQHRAGFVRSMLAMPVWDGWRDANQQELDELMAWLEANR